MSNVETWLPDSRVGYSGAVDCAVMSHDDTGRRTRVNESKLHAA